MTDPIIHQLYCTHCTYGTSALHRNTGNIKDQPFEYSTRAGSVDRPTSHETFQRFEKMYFRGLPLPSDTPADARQRLTAHSSPWRRLIAARTTSGNLLAQVAYRTTDTSTPPRTGSYFAHLLLQNAAEPPEPTWSLSDALQMWGADFWVAEERANCSHELKTVSSLQSLPGFGSVINDAALLSFLTTPPDGDFRDGRPGPSRSEPSLKCAIPARWREKPVQERRDLFTALFHSVANLNFERRERLLVAVEPSLAALLFYGIVRLLPHTGLVDQLSVSTFEPHADPFSTILTATDFYNADPARSEQHLAMVRACTAINTYGTRPVPSPPQSLYLSTMLGKFLASNQGSAAVDRTRMELKGTGKSGLSSLRDCEQYFGASELAERLLRVTPNPVSEKEVSALTLDAARQKFRLTLLTQLRSLSKNDSVWMELSQSAHRVLLIAHVLGEEPELPNSADALAQLCDCLPRNELPRFFDDRLISSDLRLKRLQREVIETGQLPAGCDSLWSPPRPGAGTDRPMLEKLFGTLDADKLKAFCSAMFESAVVKREHTSPQMLTMLTYLTRAAKGDMGNRTTLTTLLQDERLDEDHWDVLLRHSELRAALFEVYPNDEPILHVRLVDLLDQLSESGRKFPMRLDILKAAESRIPGDRRQDLSRWMRVRASLQELNELQSAPAGLIDRFVTGNRNKRMRELGASVAVDCQKILEASYGRQKPEKQLQVLKPLLRANSASGEIPASFMAGMMQSLRGSDATVPHAHNDTGHPSFVKRVLAWAPAVAAAVLIVAIAVGAYVNRAAIMASFNRSQKTADKDSVVSKSDGRSSAGASKDASTQDSKTGGANKQSRPTAEIVLNSGKESAAGNESATEMEPEAANESTTANESVTGKEPATGEKPLLASPNAAPSDKLYIAESHDLPLGKTRLEPSDTIIIHSPATELTFTSLGGTDSQSTYPRFIVSGQNTTKLTIDFKVSKDSKDLPLCVLTATPDGVTITNGLGPLWDAMENSAAEALWSVSVLGLKTADQQVYHSFHEPTRVAAAGWRLDKSRQIPKYSFDAVLPAWLSREPRVLSQLALSRGEVRLTPDDRFVYSGRAKVGRQVSLHSTTLESKMLIRACELECDNEGVQLCFWLQGQQRHSLRPDLDNKRDKEGTNVDQAIHNPSKVIDILDFHRKELVDLKNILDKRGLPSESDYKHLCRVFGIEAKAPKVLPVKKDENKDQKATRETADKKALEECRDKIREQLLGLVDLKTFGDAKTLISHFSDATLHGTLYLVVDGEPRRDGGYARGIAIKVAEFGERPVSVGGTK